MNRFTFFNKVIPINEMNWTNIPVVIVALSCLSLCYFGARVLRWLNTVPPDQINNTRRNIV